MKILLVEDDKGKARQLVEVLHQQFPTVPIVERRSFQSGLAEALTTRPDIILLDMSIPSYDSDSERAEAGEDFRPYGGREILREVARKRIKSKVIIVTQYAVFTQGVDVMTLDELKEHLASSFAGNYVTTVYYQAAQSNWKNELITALASLGFGHVEEE